MFLTAITLSVLMAPTLFRHSYSLTGLANYALCSDTSSLLYSKYSQTMDLKKKKFVFFCWPSPFSAPILLFTCFCAFLQVVKINQLCSVLALDLHTKRFRNRTCSHHSFITINHTALVVAIFAQVQREYKEADHS